MDVIKIKSKSSLVHGLIHDACYEISIGNIDGAKRMLAEADQLSHNLPRWIPVLERLPPSNWVAARFLDGDVYVYSGLTREGNNVFIGEETVHDVRSHWLEGWQWLDESE